MNKPNIKVTTEVDQNADNARKLMKVPHEVEQWNDYLKMKKFDPFDRVVLVKGIDNQILTSFRTLKGENNTVSDTFKIVHKKFQPGRGTNSFFKTMVTQQIDKLPYQTHYKLEDLQEDDEEFNDFEVYQQRQDGSFEKINNLDVPIKQEPHKLNVDANQKPASRGSNINSREEFTSSKLQHAMTAALIDIEKDGSMAASASGKPSPPDKNAKSPFKVLTTTDNSLMINLNNEVGSNGSFSEVASKHGKRMPKPKPLNNVANI